MAIVNINPGICGLGTVVEVISEDKMTAKISLKSTCPHIEYMQKDIGELDGMTEVFSRFDTSKVYQSANKNCPHLACLAPSAIIKAIEVECGLALPADVDFKIAES